MGFEEKRKATCVSLFRLKSNALLLFPKSRQAMFDPSLTVRGAVERLGVAVERRRAAFVRVVVAIIVVLVC